MTDQKIDAENQVEKEALKIPTEKERARITALNYIELSLADPTYGDARRDELALAMLASTMVPYSHSRAACTSAGRFRLNTI